MNMILKIIAIILLAAGFICLVGCAVCAYKGAFDKAAFYIGLAIFFFMSGDRLARNL